MDKYKTSLIHKPTPEEMNPDPRGYMTPGEQRVSQLMGMGAGIRDVFAPSETPSDPKLSGAPVPPLGVGTISWPDNPQPRRKMSETSGPVASQKQRITGAAHAVRLGESNVRIPQDPKFLHGGLNGLSHRIKNSVVARFAQEGRPLQMEDLSTTTQSQLDGDPVLRVQLQQLGALWIPEAITDVEPLTPEEEAEIERHNRELDERERQEASLDLGVPEDLYLKGGGDEWAYPIGYSSSD